MVQTPTFQFLSSFYLIIATTTFLTTIVEHTLFAQSPELMIVEFDDKGNLKNRADVDSSLDTLSQRPPTHLYVLAHGWNNNRRNAVTSYRSLISHISNVAESTGIAEENYRPAFFGVYWPSLAWDEDAPSNRRSRANREDLATTLCKVLPADRSPNTYLQDVLRLKELLEVPPAEATIEDQSEAMTLFRRYSIPPAQLEDQSIFDSLPTQTAIGHIQNGESRPSSIRDIFRVFTFWQMKKRAGMVGGKGGNQLLKMLQQACPDSTIVLTGHSFGCKLWLSAVTGRALDRPIDSMVLLQPAVSSYAFARRVPGYSKPGGYRLVLSNARVSGPVIATFSEHDWPLNHAFPWASWVAGQSGELERSEESKWTALGAVPAQNVGESAWQAEMKDVGKPYAFRRGIWSIKSNQVIDGHSEVSKPEVAWLILASQLADSVADVPRNTPRSTETSKVVTTHFNSASKLLGPIPSIDASRGELLEHATNEFRTKSSPTALPPIQLKALLGSDGSLSRVVSPYEVKKSGPPNQDIPKRQVRLEASVSPFLLSRSDEGIQNVEIFRPPVSGDVLLVPRNLDARITHKVPELVGTFSRWISDGESVTAAVFDGGQVRDTHQEFELTNGGSRVTIHPTVTMNVSRHATHVAGTIAAAGVEPEAKGMAPKISVLSLDWNSDLNNLDAIAQDIHVSNHSYGPSSGWSWNPTYSAWFWWGDTSLSNAEDANFGKYLQDNRLLDEILHKHQHLLTFVAAGNDRNDAPRSQPTFHYVLGRDATTGELRWQRSNMSRPQDGGSTGLDSIAGLGLSKNAICIGAIHDIVDEGDSIRITDFSSFGPTDDGRIKPDLVANGQDLLSAASAADDAYVELPGTSMASPTAAGISSLLVEQFNNVHDRQPLSTEIKAILVHTADDAGQPGPDPVFGWGSINALEAGRVISGGNGAQILSGTVGLDTPKEFRFARTTNNLQPIRATLVWLDPPGQINNGGLDDPTPTLLNDIDLSLTGPDSTNYSPYQLVRNAPLSSATNDRPNRVDNVEVVDAMAQNGEWTIRVSPHRIQHGTQQSFTLIVTGLEPTDSEGHTEPSNPADSEATETNLIPGGRSGRVALLVGINKYAHSSVPPLRGCVNDVARMKQLLMTQYEFEEEDIVTLVDQQATKQAIIDNFQDHLIKHAGKDKIAVFHFSGHGSRMEDVEDGDEQDEWDETIVPYDSRFPNKYDISDDDLNGLVSRLTAVTKNATIILDSCHSGTGTKNLAVPRVAPDDDRPAPPQSEFALPDKPAGARGTDKLMLLQNCALVYGCRADQYSYEYASTTHGTCGALTHFFIERVTKGGNKLTYRDVMDDVKREVNTIFKYQNPQLEGNPDNLVFGDGKRIAEPYISVSPTSDGVVQFQAGRIHGVTKGSVYAIYPPAEKSFGKQNRVGTVTISSVNFKTAEAKLSEEDPIRIEPSSRAVEISHNYDDHKFPVYIQGDTGAFGSIKKIHDRLTSGMKVDPTAEKSASFKEQFEVVDDRSQAKVFVFRTDDGMIGLSDGTSRSSKPEPISPLIKEGAQDLLDRITAQLFAWSKWHQVYEIHNDGKGPKVEFKVAPVVRPLGNGTPVVLSDGDQIEFTVTNESDGDIYITILDLSSDGEIGVVHPPFGKEDKIPEGGKPFTLKAKMRVPNQVDSVTDHFKLIVTQVPVSFDFLRQAAPRKLRPNPTPLEKLFADAAIVKKQAVPELIPKDGWSTVTRSVLTKK